jgi:lysophospholipase L1-like esterase
MSENKNYYILAAVVIGAVFVIRKLNASSGGQPAAGDQAALPAGTPAGTPAGSPAAQPESDAPPAGALNNASISPLVKSSALPSAPLNLKGQRVLLIGSSSALMIEKELKAALLKEGVAEFKNVGVTGSTIRKWSDNDFPEGKTLERELANYKPSLVLIILGTNDEGARQTKYNGPTYNVAKANAKSVARLKRKLSGVRSIFLGMPKPDLWPLDRNFRNMLQDTWGADFYKTEDLGLQKASDKLHLSPGGYKNWVTAIIPWFRNKKG